MSSFASSVTPSSNLRRSRVRFVRSDWSAGGSGRLRPAAFHSADNFRFGLPDGVSAGFWTPGLLDRLEEPITRYHE